MRVWESICPPCGGCFCSPDALLHLVGLNERQATEWFTPYTGPVRPRSGVWGRAAPTKRAGSRGRGASRPLAGVWGAQPQKGKPMKEEKMRG